MTRKHQLRRSGTRLQRQGALWLHQTRNAGETFLAESKESSVTFAKDMKAASTKLVNAAGRSTAGLFKAVSKEALELQSFAMETRDDYLSAVENWLGEVGQQAAGTREALKPEMLEATVLESTRDWLERAQSRVDERLEQAPKPPTDKVVSKPSATSAPAKKRQAPLRNYDRLTAKDVVSRVHRLSAPQATAVLDYERARKKRATVIRAVEQRLAAAS